MYLLVVALFAQPPATAALTHHGGPQAPQAWLAAADAQLWICWDGPTARDHAPSGTCWLPLTQLSGDLSSVRASFLDPHTLLLSGSADDRWILQRDGDIAPAPEDLPLDSQLAPLLARTCSTTGWLPTYDDGEWTWRTSPCDSPHPCPRLLLLPRSRPTGVLLRLSLTLTWRTQEQLRGSAIYMHDLQLLAALTLGFDPNQHRAAAEQRRALTRAGRLELRSPPRPKTYGALAEAERRSLASAVCGAKESL
ncbi:MAG: hypothetical protein IPK80_31775 [Nannocystis sp.]|nr:hypothetical protein [Nannocystis sp.]